MGTYLPFLIVFVMAFMVEALTEYFAGLPFSKIPKLEPFKWLLAYLAAGVGIVGAFVYHLDIFQMLGDLTGTPMPQQQTFGVVLTGLGIGRGSSFIHDLYSYILATIKLLLTRAEK